MAATDPWTIGWREPAYPAALLELGRVGRGGRRASSDGGAPTIIHGCGSRDLVAGLGAGRAVTIVGARRCSTYGRRVAHELAGSLSAAGLVVISGMAFGIDTAAHLGALEAQGPTIAVLAGGPDVPYPPSSRRVHARILESGGATVAESEPGRSPARWDFPARNRIMAALAEVTVVVEATERSGSRITADVALHLGRDVGAVPGPVHSALSAGPHALLCDGAFPVTGAQDILDRLLGVGAVSATRIGPAIEPELKAVLDAVECQGASAELVAARCAVRPPALAVALARLELLGYLRHDAGRYVPTGLTPSGA